MTIQNKRERFVAELTLAATSQDSKEVVTAFRAATAILASTNMTWAQFVASRPPIGGNADGSSPSASSSPSPRGDELSDATVIRPLLEKAMRNTDPHSSFYGFLTSLSEQFEDRGYLTQRQFDSLRRSANR